MSESSEALAKLLIRNFNDVPCARELRKPLYDTVCARLARGTAARKLGASIDTVAPGMRSCPYHFHHAQEEMFVILEGNGTLRVAGEMLPLRAGDVAFIPPGPGYPHQIINTSDAPLKYLSISTRDMPEIVEYPDSRKYLANAPLADGKFFDTLQRTENGLDYWDGEP
ncbi:MAG TPA: cupin domain-containing protein [Burkholderiales bacterium]|nr:cupin domain-containing protein [Burkholderiales bacterium]